MDDCIYDPDYEPAALVMYTTTPTPLRQCGTNLVGPTLVQQGIKPKYDLNMESSTFIPTLTSQHQCSSNPLTMKMANYDDERIRYPYPLTPTLNSWGAKSEPESEVEQYVMFMPTKSTTPSLTHTRTSLSNNWSMNSMEDAIPTTALTYLECPTPINCAVRTNNKMTQVSI
jgi:hypothetical protein